MQKKQNKKAFIVYEFDKFENDYKYIKEYFNKEEIIKDYGLQNKISIYHYIAKSCDAIKQLMQDKYIIIEEVIK